MESDDQPRFASFDVRLLAAMIDCVIVLPFFVMAVALHPRWRSGEVMYILLTSIGVAWIAATQFEAWSGQTVGKLVLRISISKADATRAPLGALVARWLIKMIPIAFYVLAGIFRSAPIAALGAALHLTLIGACMYLTDWSIPRGWHDRITGTAVFYEMQAKRRQRPQPRGFEPILKPSDRDL